MSLNLTHKKHFKKTSKLFGPNKEERKQERKANRIITLDSGNEKKVELKLRTQKTSHKQSHSETSRRL